MSFSCTTNDKWMAFESAFSSYILANKCVQPESFELSGAEIDDRIMSNSRSVIKIIPKGFESLGPLERGGSRSSIYNSSQSLSSSSGDREPRVLFLGFTEMWERDMWNSWLTEVS